MDKERSAISEVIKRSTIGTITEYITEEMGVGKAAMDSIRAMLALAWIEGAHIALWMPYAAAQILVGSKEVSDLVRDTLENVVDAFIDKEAPETTGDDRAELYETIVNRERHIPITNLTKKDEDPAFLTYFLKES